MLRNDAQRGDTLIEVLLAIAVLSVVTIGTFSLMNKGISESQNALERTQVRTYMNAQTELLTYLRDQHAAAVAAGTSTTVYPVNLWTDIATRAAANVSTAPSAYDNCSTVMANSFSLSPTATSTYAVNSFTAANLATATLATPGSGLWIEPKASPVSLNPAYQKYIDFYVKACWTPISSSTKQNMSSVVRLYVR